ncbi:MAG: hypothetical protein K2X37_07845 [Chitinophagaceae bacterium]|nr:hypothetical protein [Chitinophagaceae bacterium]
MTKQFPLFFITIFFTLISNAQITKGNWLVGGNGSIYSYTGVYTTPSSNDISSTYTNVDFSSSIGYFCLDKFSLGLRPIFSSEKGGSSGGGSSNSYRFAIGPFFRYYFLKDSKQFNILTDISYQIGILQQLGSLKERGKFNTFSIMAGTEVFFNNTVGLELLVGYRNQISSIENSPSAFNNNKKGIQTSIGFIIHLEK